MQKLIEKEITLADKLGMLSEWGINFETATIFISGEITSGLSIGLRIKADMLAEYFRYHEKPLTEINLVMNSFGGDADAIFSTLDWYDELKSKGILVNMLIEGNCMSAATFIAIGATGKRRATKRTRLMVHELQLSGIGGTHTQTKALQTEIDRMQKEYYEAYAQFTKFRGKKPSADQLKKAAKEWETLCTKETYFSAAQAKVLGMIDEIV